MAVDIGSEAIDRDDSHPPDHTLINKDNPASIAGLITSIDIWASQDITGLRVGTFYVISGNTLKCRASETIAGTIPSGSRVTKTISIAVEIGDYIGCYYTGGRVEEAISGYAGFWNKTGAYIDPDDQADYTFLSNLTNSFGGYISPVVAPTVTTQAVDGIGFD